MPQGSLDESKPKSRNNVYIAVFAILAFHVVLLGALLLQGCKDSRPLSVVSKPSVLDPMNTQPVGVSNTIPTDPFMQPNQIGAIPTTPVSPAPLTPPVAPVPNIMPTPVVDIAPPVPVPAISAPVVQEHVVAKGDSFYVISKKYGVSQQAIAKANPGVDSRKLKIGTKIKIPEKSAVQATATSSGTKLPGSDLTFGNNSTTTGGSENVYVVKPGDNLTKIVKRTGVSAKQIKVANNLPTDMIRVGQKLKIPSKTASAAPAIEAAPVAPVVPMISPEPVPTPMTAPVNSGTT